jgi:hypothetical protein
MRELKVFQQGVLPLEYAALRQQREEMQPLLQERTPTGAGPEGRKPSWLWHGLRGWASTPTSSA